MIVRCGVAVVMVAVECFFKALGVIVRGNVVLPLRHMQRNPDDASPREHQAQKGQSRGEGGQTAHSGNIHHHSRQAQARHHYSAPSLLASLGSFVQSGARQLDRVQEDEDVRALVENGGFTGPVALSRAAVIPRTCTTPTPYPR